MSTRLSRWSYYRHGIRYGVEVAPCFEVPAKATAMLTRSWPAVCSGKGCKCEMFVDNWRCFWVFSCFWVGCVACEPCRAENQNRPEGTISIQRSIPFKVLKSGKKLLADVYLPANNAQTHPTLLMIHGGAWFSGNKVHVAYHANYAAEQGYAVMAINYRLAPQSPFPAQLEDCRDALGWIARHAEQYQFDCERTAVYGYSAGAQLACLVAMSQNAAGTASGVLDPAKALPTVQAVVAGGAPCEFSWIPDDAETLAYWLGGSRDAVPKAYDAASPTEFVDRGDPPVFLYHGTADRIVPMSSPQKFVTKLNAAAVDNRLYLVQGASHLGAFVDKQARAQAIQFLDQHLRD